MTRIVLSSLIVLAAVISLSAAVPACAATYDWTYEGDVVPGGLLVGGPSPPTASSDGNILTINFATGSPGADYWYSYLLGGAPGNTADTWTLDFRIARPTAAGSWGNTADDPAGIDLYIAGAGTGGRILMLLGRKGYGGLGGGSPAYDDSSTLTINPGVTTEVIVPGLDIRGYNDYRVVGTGGGAFNVYVNDIVAPVYSGLLTGTTSTKGLGYGQQFAAANSATDADMLVDYFRMNNSIGYNERPVVPEPAAWLLMAVGAVVFICHWAMRRERADAA